MIKLRFNTEKINKEIECNSYCCNSLKMTSLQFNDGNVWLVNVNDGSQLSILESFNFNKISAIFITELSGSHLYGIIGLLAMLQFRFIVTSKERETVNIVGPKGLKSYCDSLLALSDTFIKFNNLNFMEIEADQKLFSIPVQSKSVWTAYAHVVGEKKIIFQFSEAGQPKLDIEKMKKQNIPLKYSNTLMKEKSVEIEGIKVLFEDFCLEPQSKRNILFVPSLENEKYSFPKHLKTQKFDLLVYEFKSNPSSLEIEELNVKNKMNVRMGWNFIKHSEKSPTHVEHFNI
jgi:ribonuclease BN (tRNA processing enzyme)